MAQLALSASATLTPFDRTVNKPGKMASICWKRNTVHSWLFANSPRWKGIRFAAASTDGVNGVAADGLEDEKALNSYSWPDKKRPRVCILGGGFGGLYTALRLESLEWPDDKKPQVLLVDQSKNFVFKPMLYELLSGEVEPWEIAPQFSDLLVNTSVQFHQDRVKLLHILSEISENGSERSTCSGTVLLESGLRVEYDWLVLALGAKSNLDLVPGAVEYALPFSNLEDACRVNDKLKDLERKTFGKGDPIHVVIVGCGYSGVELAATISERLQDKGVVQAVNVDSTICPSAPPGNREAALKVLLDRNVKLVLGYMVRSIRKASEVAGFGLVQNSDQDGTKGVSDKLVLDLQPAQRGLQGQILEADLVLWTVGNKAELPQLEPSDRPHQLPLNSRGQVETDDTLSVKGHPRIFAIGDTAAFRDSSGKILPSTAQSEEGWMAAYDTPIPKEKEVVADETPVQEMLTRHMPTFCTSELQNVGIWSLVIYVAFQQADFVGWNLWAAINERPLLPFRFQNLGEMMTLGRFDAAVTPTFIDGLTLEGPIGHAARKLAYLIRLPTDEHRLKVGVSWFAKTAIDSVATLQTTITKTLSGS